MSHNLRLAYAGTPYLDRTQALRTGEVVPSGIALAFQPIRWGAATLDALEHARVDVAEISLADAFSLARANDERFVALPVFLARAFPFTFLKSSTDVAVDSLDELARKRFAVRKGDESVAVWARVALESMADVSFAEPWRSLDEDLLERAAAAAEVDVVVTTQTAGPFVTGAVADVHVRNRDAFDAMGCFPILTTVLLRREIYDTNRWVAAALVDAFCEAKEIGNRRLRYFGALGVLLPFLQSSLDEVEVRFSGDAFPYGLSRNEAALSAFERAWSTQFGNASKVEFGAYVAPEVRSHPGVPESTFYVVPMSHV